MDKLGSYISGLVTGILTGAVFITTCMAVGGYQETNELKAKLKTAKIDESKD